MTDAASRAEVALRQDIWRARWRVLGLIGLLSVIGLAMVVAVALNAEELGRWADDFGVLAWLALLVGGTLLIAAMVPASLVAGACGFALGSIYGFVPAIVAATAGGVLCAAIARSAGTPAARHAFGRSVARSVEFADGRPVRTVMTARLLPGLPFNGASYALGLTAIPLRDIALGTAVGFTPRCFAYVALGGSLRDLGSPEARVAIAASALLVIVVIVGPRLVVRAAPKAGR